MLVEMEKRHWEREREREWERKSLKEIELENSERRVIGGGSGNLTLSNGNCQW